MTTEIAAACCGCPPCATTIAALIECYGAHPSSFDISVDALTTTTQRQGGFGGCSSQVISMTDVQLSLRGALGWNACYYGGLARLHIKYNRWWLVNTGGWGGGVWEMFAVSALVSQDVFTRLNIYPTQPDAFKRIDITQQSVEVWLKGTNCPDGCYGVSPFNLSKRLGMCVDETDSLLDRNAVLSGVANCTDFICASNGTPPNQGIRLPYTEILLYDSDTESNCIEVRSRCTASATPNVAI